MGMLFLLLHKVDQVKTINDRGRTIVCIAHTCIDRFR